MLLHVFFVVVVVVCGILFSKISFLKEFVDFKYFTIGMSTLIRPDDVLGRTRV